ncbi:MAG: tetratricopeptide repeat protein, partial [Gammaproteobacteria bacterium]
MSFIEELKRRNVIKVAVLYGVASWLLLQVADLLFDAFGVPDWSIRLLLAFIILGFPLTLILSWVYEMTPEGIKREKDIDRDESITPETGRKINILIVVLLVMAIAAVVVDRLIPETGGPAEQPVAAATDNDVT